MGIKGFEQALSGSSQTDPQRIIEETSNRDEKHTKFTTVDKTKLC